jgi:two-component system, oxyanion-binding sensor
MSVRRSRPIGKHAIHIGFVPLIDAAPLVVAHELGFFTDEGLDVRLDRQIGWGNIRDKLSYGHLHAAHALIGMPPASVAGIDGYYEPLVGLMSLGSGGNAITLSKALVERDPSPASWRRELGRPLNLAHVFSCSSHHYLLRDYLERQKLNPDRDARLCVMPPPQLGTQLAGGLLDGFCVGEPWNTLAMLKGHGTIIAATTELMPDHPEKVLAVTQRWHQQNLVLAESMVRAVIRGCDYCEDPIHRSRLSEILARREYLAVDEDVIDKSLSIDTWLKPGVRRPPFRSFARPATQLRAEHVEWIVSLMIHWNHLPADTDAHRIAAASVSGDAYTEAVNTLSSKAVLQGSKS